MHKPLNRACCSALVIFTWVSNPCCFALFYFAASIADGKCTDWEPQTQQSSAARVGELWISQSTKKSSSRESSIATHASSNKRRRHARVRSNVAKSSERVRAMPLVELVRRFTSAVAAHFPVARTTVARCTPRGLTRTFDANRCETFVAIVDSRAIVPRVCGRL